MPCAYRLVRRQQETSRRAMRHVLRTGFAHAFLQPLSDMPRAAYGTRRGGLPSGGGLPMQDPQYGGTPWIDPYPPPRRHSGRRWLLIGALAAAFALALGVGAFLGSSYFGT